MMTIKEFAGLCNCNAQTLRYYDRIDLLKPVQVDKWTGYRYYEKTQAIDFIKIKNLQEADFTIEEIKALLQKNDEQVYEAFSIKIAEQTQKLTRIRKIQQSYLKEKSTMEQLIQGLTGFLMRQLSDLDGLKEFGLNPDDGDQILDHIRRYMERWMVQSSTAEQEVCLQVDDEIFRGAERVTEKINTLSEDNLPGTILLGDETLSENDRFDPDQYQPVWQADGWNHVYEFIDAIPELHDGEDYCFFFRLNQETYNEDIAFPMFMLGAMILKKGCAEVLMGCSVEKSEDAKNHFTLMRKA